MNSQGMERPCEIKGRKGDGVLAKAEPGHTWPALPITALGWDGNEQMPCLEVPDATPATVGHRLEGSRIKTQTHSVKFQTRNTNVQNALASVRINLSSGSAVGKWATQSSAAALWEGH